MVIEYLHPTKTVWSTDRANTVGASEIGACARQTWYRKNGTPPETNENEGWGYRERGHVVEAWAVRNLRQGGVRLIHKQRTLVRGFLSATVDAILGRTCVDFKSYDPRLREIVKPRHVLQVQTQIGLWREVGRRRVEDGLLVYINASDFGDGREITVPRNDDAYAAAHERARRIMTAANPMTLPAEGRIAGGRECERCPFQTACLGAPVKGNGHLSPAERERLEVVRSSVEIERQRIEAAEANIARLRESARNVLRDADVKREPGIASLRRTSRTTLDAAAMEADGIDLSKYRRPGRPSESVAFG